MTVCIPRGVGLFVVVMLMFGSIGRSSDCRCVGQEESPNPAKLVVEPAGLTLDVGESANLEATVTDEDGNELEVPVLFFSRARRELTVSRDGNVTAIRSGQFEIVARTPREPDGSRLEITVPVLVNKSPLAKIEFGELPENLYDGTSVSLAVTAIDETGLARENPAWMMSSSNSEIAVVDSLGNVSIRGVGNVQITAETEGIKNSIELTTIELPVSEVRLSIDREQALTGDVIHLNAKAYDADGVQVEDVPLEYSFRHSRSGELLSVGGTGQLHPSGRFVAEREGDYTLFASCGPHTAQATVRVERRSYDQKITVVGRGLVNDKHTSDLWVWEGVDGRDYAVTGTWGADGEAIFWDVTDPTQIERISSVQVDARTVNDVKVSEDGSICIISREGASSRKNGIVLIDVKDPRNPEILARFNDELTGGVHNLFIHDDHVFAINNGRRYDVISIKDPENPVKVGQFELTTPGHAIHDVWVVDGLAYSSNWGDGLYVVDVGNGIAGGSPEQPIVVENYTIPNGAHHAAFPYENKLTGRKYVICGDERFPNGLSIQGKPTIAGGYLHIVDVTDKGAPIEVARYEVPEAGSHNFWIEGDICYAAMYNAGLRVIDLSGELMGDLYKQGREVAWFIPHDPEGYIPNASMVWGPQPHKGVIYFSDWNTGLWAVRLEPK